MKCPKCQREINEDNQYCPYCGHRLEKREDPVLEEIKNMRRNMALFVMNRIMNIATFVAIVFAIIGMFGPVLSYVSTTSTIEIGGLYWFSYEGWVMLRDGQLSVGPFITTFILYLLTFTSVVAVSSHAITRAINSLRRKEECKTVPHIIFLSIIYKVYSAFVSNFYYEYISNQAGTFATDSAWGETTYNVAIPFFTIALMVYIVMKAVFTNKPKIIISRIFTLVIGFVLIGSILNAFSCLGFQDINIGEQVVFGTLHYFNATNGVPLDAAIVIILMFILGLSLIASSIVFSILILRNLVKHDEINRKLLLAAGITFASIVTLMTVVDLSFGAVVNNIDGFENNILHISGNLWLYIFESQFVLGLCIATYCIKEDEPKDNNIIDVEVFDKEDA